MQSNLLTVVDGKPVFRSVNPLLPTTIPSRLEGRHQAVDVVVRAIRENTPASPPFFFHVFLGNWLITMDMAKEIVQQLGPKLRRGATRPAGVTLRAIEEIRKLKKAIASPCGRRQEAG